MRVILLIFVLTLNVQAQFFVSPNGDDGNNGTFDFPFKTIQKAFDVISTTGDTIYLRGGIYEQSLTLEPPISGNENQNKVLTAYQKEKPIVDFSAQEYSSSSRGLKLTKNYWHIRGLEIQNAGDNGIHISGHFNKIENCSLHHNKDTGLQISNGGSYNEIINCDSYLNYDSNTNGENADGFAPKLDIGPGNYFNNCRAWLNSDDGWDCYEGQNQIIIDSCWAFKNGFNIWDDSNFQGDGNGFKLGGNYISAPHIIRNSIAFDNKSKGFDQNHNTAGITVLNCTAYRNERNYSFSENPTDSIFTLHILKNNISFDGTNSIVSTSIDTSNSWNGFFVTWQDFLSIDTSLAIISRDENYQIPYTDFLRLKPTSQFVDAGIDVGIPYFGEAPDIGAFENGSITNIETEKTILNEFALLQNYPNPFNPTTTIKYTIANVGSKNFHSVQLIVYDILGKKIITLVNDQKQAGVYEVKFDASRLSSGIYFYKLSVGNFISTRKMIFIK
jgi:hypothetical protein